MLESRPAYRVLSEPGFFGPDDTLYGEGSEIYFDGEPNDNLEPLNEAAVQKMQDFITKVDTYARDAALKVGRPYSGRPKNEDGIYEMARAVALAKIPVMGNLQPKETTSIAPVNAPDVPDTGRRRGRGRPKSKAEL